MRQNKTSFNKNHPKEPSSHPKKRTTKTELDYYENYPYLIPPYALNNYQAYLQLMYSGSTFPNTKQQSMLAPPGLLAPGLFHPGMMYTGNFSHIPPGYVKKNQLFPLKNYDASGPTMGYTASAEDSFLVNLYKESYVNKLKPGQAQRTEEKENKKNNRSKSKTVTYNLDNLETEYSSDEDENEPVEEKIIKVGKPTSINPGILRNADRDGSKMKIRSESQEFINRSESKEKLHPSESGVNKGFSLKVDFDHELEKLEIVRRRKEFATQRLRTESKENKNYPESVSKPPTDKTLKPITLRIDKETENERVNFNCLEKMRRRKEFSENVRSIDNIPHIVRQRLEKENLHKDSQQRQFAHFYDKLNMNNQIPHNKIESVIQFDKFIELQKMQFTRINKISQNYNNSNSDLHSSDTYATYDSRASNEIFSNGKSVNLYIPERKRNQ